MTNRIIALPVRALNAALAAVLRGLHLTVPEPTPEQRAEWERQKAELRRNLRGK